MGRKSKRKKFKQAHIQTRDNSPHGDLRSNGKSPSVFLIEVIRWGAYLALFSSLVVHPSFFFPFVVPKAIFFWIFTEIIFASWLLLAISNKQFRPKWNPISIAFGVFLFVTILTSFTGVNVERSFWSTFERMAGTVNWIHLGLFFFVLTSVFRTIADWRKLLTTSFIASCIVALLFLVDRLGIAVIPFETRSGATIGNSSFMATYLLFNVFFGIWLLLKTKGEWQKIFYGTGLGGLVFSMLVSTAFGALTSMFGGFFIILLTWLFFKARFRYAKSIAVAFFLLGVFTFSIVAYGTMNQNKAIVSKLPYYFSDSGTIGARKVVWEMAVQGVKERPILGWGPENFNVVFTKHFNPCLVLSKCGGEVWFDRTHNVLFDQLIHSGIVGLLSYLAIFGAVFLSMWKIALHFRNEWVMSGVIIAVFASYFVQNLLVFDMPSSYIMFAFSLAFAGGMANIALLGKPEPKGAGLNIPKPFSIVMVGFLFIYFVFSFGIQSFQDANWGIVINRSSLSIDKKIELYKKSLSVSPLGNRQVPEFFTNNMVTVLNQDAEIPADAVKEIGEIMEKIRAKNPLDFRHYLILGNYYAAAKKYDATYLDKSEELLKKAVELSPKNQQGYASLGQVYLMKGEIEKGIDMLKKVVELEPRYDNARITLADAYANTEKYKEAKELYEDLFEEGHIPTDISRLAKIVKAYEELKEYDNAIVWFREVVLSEAGKNNGDAHFMLAELYLKGGYKGEAREEALKAKSLKPELAEDIEEFLDSLK